MPQKTSKTRIYGATPTKRRTKRELGHIKEAICNLLAEYHPMTVRQVFYRLVSGGIVAKSEDEYKNAVGRNLVLMRHAGEISFDWIADNTRCVRKPQSYLSVEEALAFTVQTYRRDLWDNQETYVEIWTEKDAIAGVLLEETAPWDVPLMVARGFSSITFLHEAAQAIQKRGKAAYLYYFGDHDPSGVCIDRTVEKSLRQYAPDAEIHFQRIAVTEAQIKNWKLPTRPTKKTDSRSKSFRGESVEVDAIPPRDLRKLVSDCIQQHVNGKALKVLRIAETRDRETLQRVARCA